MIFATFDAYEHFLYTLPDAYKAIQLSTLTFIRHGKSVAVVRGELFFANDTKLVIRDIYLHYQVLKLQTMATRSGKVAKNCTGTTRNLIRIFPNYKPPTPIISMFRRTLNIIVSLHPVSVLPGPICRF